MKKFVTLSIILIGLLLIVGTSHYRNEFKAIPVVIATADTGTLSDTILASGNLEFKKEIQLSSEITARVKEVFVEEGQFIEQGQTLMILDSTSLEAGLARATAIVNSQKIAIERFRTILSDYERQYYRQSKLFEKGVINGEAIEALKNKLDIARIDVESAQITLTQGEADLAVAKDHLSKTIYRAPISGLLTSVDVKPGETVIAGSMNIVGSPLMTLADIGAIYANLRVDEADISNVHLHQEAEIYAASYPKKAIKGKVTQIATSARPNQQGQGLFFRVKVALDPSDFELYSGMSCRGEIIISQRKADVQVPIAAIQKNDKSNYVWVIEDDHAQKREVTLGMATDLSQEILTGLVMDDEIIIGPARTISSLTSGTRVKTQDKERI